MNRPEKTLAPSNSADPQSAYDRLLARGELRPDDDQALVVARLQRLHIALTEYPSASGRTLSLQNWRLSNLFGTNRTKTPSRGLYLHGGVGRGKTMLMDLFYETAPVRAKARRHFHEFMQDIHGRIHRWRHMSGQERIAAGGRADEDDPLPPVARQIAEDACLLCFDEFHISDVADAMILGRLFKLFWEFGVVIVLTSNRHPDSLYEGGLNRQLFLPTIELIKHQMEVTALDGPRDYRLLRMKGMKTWLTPINDESTQMLRRDFYRLTDREVDDPALVPSAEIEVQGRRIFVPKACKGVAVFSFKRLCGQPLGAADYLAIARRFHTLIIVAVPQLGAHMRNEAKRFVILIDILYENGVKLLASAAVEPDALYPHGDGKFEFSRTVSRLVEMQSNEYLKRGHGVNPAAGQTG